jgi:hypothetical protein
MTSAIAGGMLFCLGLISFFMTMPLGGDEMSMLWLFFIAPGFLIAGLVLLAVSLPAILIALLKRREQPPE